MCGGGGGGTEQQQLGSWSPEIGPYWHKYLDQGEGLAAKPYQQYGGQRIADFHPAQIQGLDNINTLANNGGTTLSKAADDQAFRTLGGSYLNGPDKNPWSTLFSQTGRNAYSGTASPYFSQVMGQGLDSMADAYQKGTAADTTRMFNLSGAFGGSAHQNAVKDNESALAGQMKQYISGMQNDQYNRSAGLEESYLGRDLSNQQYNMNKGNADWEAERGRQMGMVPTGSQNISDAMKIYGGQVGVGDAYRGWSQDVLNQNYTDWQAQQNHPYAMQDWFTGLLSRAQGGMAPSYTQSGGGGYQANPLSQLFGGAMAAKGMGFF